MGKLDKIMSTMGGNIAQSMGAGQEGVSHGDSGLTPPATPARMQGISKARNTAEIPVGRIVRDPNQPREEFDPDGLKRLAESLKAKGQLQPIRVRWDEDQGKYVILCGERRWRAAEIAEMATLTCVIHEGPLEQGELLALQLIENCLREDLRPIEQALAFRQLIERNGWSARQLARELALTQSSVARALSLLDLPEEVQHMVDEGTIAPATACEVSRLENPGDQVDVAKEVVKKKLTRDQTAEAVKSRKSGRRPGATPGRSRKVEYRVEGGTVAVQLDQPDIDPVVLLERALDQARRQARAEAA
jgi:ParB family transcriptional regulator, chromosome partitioning protein